MADKKSDKQGGKGMVILLVVMALLLLIAVGVGAYVIGTRESSAANDPADQPTLTVQSQTGKGAAQGPLVELDEFIVNLMDEQETRYLKAALTLELSNQAVVEEVGLRKAQVRDAVLLLIGSKTFDELRDLQGKLQLRAELARRINEFLGSGKVAKIYFTDFVVQ